MFQPFDEAPSRVLRLQPVKKVGSGFAIGLLPLEPVIGHDQDRVGHGQHCALLAAPAGPPAVLRTQLGLFGPDGRVSRLHQGGPQEAIALACLARCALAGAFMLAGGHTDPRGEVVGTRTATHGGADLGHEHFGGVASHPRDGSEQAHRLFKRAIDRLDLRIKAGDGLIQSIDLTQQLGQHKAMMRFDPPVQRLG
jgi:hypothetical protein